MNIIQFIWAIIAPHIPGDQVAHEAAISQVNDSWADITPDNKGTFIQKAKFYLDNPIAKLALAALSIFAVKLVSDLLQKWIGDRDQDGDVDPIDGLLAVAQNLSQIAERMKVSRV